MIDSPLIHVQWFGTIALLVVNSSISSKSAQEADPASILNQPGPQHRETARRAIRTVDEQLMSVCVGF
jgi:anthranilate/para-aminobenzoate synthase component II